MEPEAKYTVVGAAVLMLLAAIVVSIVWLRSSAGQRDDVPYKIYFAQQSLEGLQIRSDVKMKGIKVGAVTGFRISSRRPGSVEVLIRVDGSAPVRGSTRATIERQLVTGIASIRLVNGDEQSPLLSETPADEAYPVIAEGEPEYQLSRSMAELAQRADETMQRINLVLSDENQVALGGILVDLRRAVAEVNRTMPVLKGTLVSMTRTSDELRSVSREVAGRAASLAARYETLAEASTQTMKELSTTVRGIGGDVTQLTGRLDDVLADGSIEFRLTAQELRATAGALGNVARRLRDPADVVFGPSKASLGPGEGGR